MRTKFLFLIASFVILSFAITSCLDSDDNYEPGSDDIIAAFTLDTIYAINYKFTINQYGGEDGTVGEIFNVDSIPYSADTIVNKILIKSIVTNGYVTSGKTALEDTLFVISDSLDLSNTMEEPLVIRVRSYDNQHIKEYRIEVRRHLTDPDSLVWGGSGQEAYTESFSNGIVSADKETKAVTLNNEVIVFTFNGTNIVAYLEGAPATVWSDATTDLPSNTKLSSLLNFDNVLYATTTDGEVLSSTTGINWSSVTSDADVESFLTSFYGDSGDEEFISGITQYQEDLNEDGVMETVRRFATATFDAGVLTWTKGDVLSDDFPKENITAIKSYKTNTGIQMAMLIGKSNDEEPTKTIPWFSINGLTWAPMETINSRSLPVMERPSIIYYGNTLYAFGDDFSNIYTSLNGLVWNAVTKKFLFPDDANGTPIFEGRSADYSMLIDDDNYIWMIWNKGTSYTDQVWKGKLNKLGFLIQD